MYVESALLRSFKMIPMNAPNLRGEYIFKMVPREI